MSTAVELPKNQIGEHEFTKLLLNDDVNRISTGDNKTQEHPLHQYDLTKMSKFYEACVAKLSEKEPKWKPNEWVKSAVPMPNNLSTEEQKKWQNPVVISEKQRVYESFVKLAQDLGEPMIIMPNFDISDLQNFELFLDSLKTDGVNAVRRYRQFLNNKDMRKQEVDLVIVHPRYGLILIEVKDNDYVDARRKSRAKSVVNQTKSLFKSLGRLIAESKGLSVTESSVPVMEFVALPKVQERPVSQVFPRQQPQPQTQNGESQSAQTPKPLSQSRHLNYIVKSDLESSAEFIKWWSKNVVEPKLEQEKLAEEQKKVNKFDWSMLNSLVALVNCIRANSILPVVYPASTDADSSPVVASEPKKEDCEESKSQSELLPPQFQPALNIHAEFFKPKHEESRSLTKCLVLSKDSERIRKTICLQTLWLLLNDSQKKISVVCSELNKPYYEEFFSRQRKIYSSLNNVRFYTDLHSCDPSGQHTLKKDGEVWFFDSSIPNGSLSDVLERAKSLTSYWAFSEEKEDIEKLKEKLNHLQAKLVNLDEDKRSFEQSPLSSSHETLNSIKLPLRLQCDLLIVGDMISASQLPYLYKNLQNKSVISLASFYQHSGTQQHHQHNHPQVQHLNFNPAKKFRSVKFIRGGTIDNIRQSLMMHDSIQAQCIFVHAGDEDLFKTRNNSVATIERIKELATLVKEFCPKSFVVLSTLMRRMSRTENAVSNEVNKGLREFCKQTKETLNLFYMLNNHFEPDYHTQGGRLLSNKGLKLYVDNILFVVDYFLIKNNKQH